jgi:hypothetical protein
MADRYDLKTARTGRDGKTYWTKIGVMFPMREKDGFSITLEALPIQQLNDDGRLECRITAWEPFKEGKGGGNGASRPEPELPTGAPEVPEPTGETLDDKIPF